MFGERSRAVVAGAGIGGLAAGAALAPLFEQVTIVEKDTLLDGAIPRKGVAQGHHVHVFLVGGLTSLNALFPGILDDFQRAGAEQVGLGAVDFFDFGQLRPHRELDLAMYCLSRPTYERVVRQRVCALPNVELRERCRVEAIEVSNGRAVGLHVRGESLEVADFVVDATGRGAALVDQLERTGFGRTPIVQIGIDMCYASARFRLDDRWHGRTAAMCVPTPPDKRYGVLLPIEGGQCIVSLGGRCGIEPEADLASFLDYAKQLACPSIYERIRDADLLSPIRRYHKPTADWRRYEQLQRFPERLAPVGDTVASFNPTWGQGMTVAVRHALLLRQTIEACGIAGPAFGRSYLPAAAAASEEAWNGTALIDLAYPEVSGERPEGFEQSLAFMHGLRLLADSDPAVHKLQFEVMQLARPAAALGDPALASRVGAISAQQLQRPLGT